MKRLINIYIKLLKYFVYMGIDFEERYSKNAQNKKIGKHSSKRIYYKI